MVEIKTPSGPNIVAVYADHDRAESAIRRLHKEGFALDELSIVGRDIQVTEEPRGFVSTGDYVSAGARTGAAAGGLAGMALGAALLLVPGIGPVVVAGPLAAALLAGIEGALAGVALGALSGALIGLGVPREHAIKYETAVKGGKYLVMVRGGGEDIERARRSLAADEPEQVEVHDAVSA
jgi:uncharacterized membrane protein